MTDALLLLVVIPLATYRAWRLLFVDDFPPIAGPRRRFTDWVQERWGDDWADGIACPWCSGAWVSIAATAIAAWFIPVPIPVAYALAVSAVVGIIGGQLDG